jgi:predicted Fe-S protein YdhL (DUF1289 family)
MSGGNVESPCISVCKIDKDGYCLGCGRTLDEIRSWKLATDQEKAEILVRLSERRQGP